MKTAVNGMVLIYFYHHSLITIEENQLCNLKKKSCAALPRLIHFNHQILSANDQMSRRHTIATDRALQDLQDLENTPGLQS